MLVLLVRWLYPNIASLVFTAVELVVTLWNIIEGQHSWKVLVFKFTERLNRWMPKKLNGWQVGLSVSIVTWCLRDFFYPEARPVGDHWFTSNKSATLGIVDFSEYLYVPLLETECHYHSHFNALHVAFLVIHMHTVCKRTPVSDLLHPWFSVLVLSSLLLMVYLIWQNILTSDII